MVAFTFGNALWAAWDQGTTYDEYYHLEWPRRLLHGRIDERASAYRFESKTPALLPAVLTINGLEKLGVDGGQAVRFAGRLTSIGYFALCLGLVALLARPFGRAAAWLAVLLVRGQGADVDFRPVPVDRLATPYGQDAPPVSPRS